MIKNKILIALFCLSIFLQNAQGQHVAVFCGGDMYDDIEKNATTMKQSGFNTCIFWSIHISKDGDLILNNSRIIADGAYVGKENWPAEVIKLREGTTSVNRIEFSVGAWGVPDFENIEALINSEGTGESSILYRNFAKLKEITGADAIDFDDESNYDAGSTVKFSKMLIGMGYKITLCPYTRKTFWQTVFSQVEAEHPGEIDRVYLQCYAGGATNKPAAWNSSFGSLKVTPGLWSTHGAGCSSGLTTPFVKIRLNGWKDDIAGGFIWSFWDMVSCSNVGGTPRDYGKAIRSVMGMETVIPGKAQQPDPANTATEISVDADLSWISGSWDAEHIVYFGTSSELTESDLKGTFIDAGFDPGTLENNSTYYWRVDQVNDVGTTTGDVWEYTTELTTALAAKATSPMPADNAVNVDIRTHLSWSTGQGTITNKVYFGTTNPPPYIEELTDTIYQPDILSTNTTYYWRIDETNSSGDTEGDTWSFTTHGHNIAPEATVTVSTEYSATYGGSKAIDGIAMIHDRGEWASKGEKTPWIKLTWSEEVNIQKIKLYDRANEVDYIESGTLTFSDGSSIEVGTLPNNGDLYLVEFDEKKVSWVKFSVDIGGGSNVGLSEFEVIGDSDVSGINEIPSERINAYPNPSSEGTFYLNIPSGEMFDLEICNADGQVIKHIEHYKGVDAIDIKKHPRGLYIIHANNGRKSYVSKLLYF